MHWLANPRYVVLWYFLRVAPRFSHTHKSKKGPLMTKGQIEPIGPRIKTVRIGPTSEIHYVSITLALLYFSLALEGKSCGITACLHYRALLFTVDISNRPQHRE